MMIDFVSPFVSDSNVSYCKIQKQHVGRRLSHWINEKLSRRNRKLITLPIDTIRFSYFLYHKGFDVTEMHIFIVGNIFVARVLHFCAFIIFKVGISKPIIPIINELKNQEFGLFRFNNLQKKT